MYTLNDLIGQRAETSDKLSKRGNETSVTKKIRKIIA